MLKRNITYEDFNGATVTETFYFNLSKTEIVDLEMEYEGGLQAVIERIIETKDKKALVNEFKKLVLMSYGVKSDDGKRFIKNEELRAEFAQTAAYDALFIELATNDNAAADFIIGIAPKDLVEAAEAANRTPNIQVESPQPPEQPVQPAWTPDTLIPPPLPPLGGPTQ